MTRHHLRGPARLASETGTNTRSSSVVGFEVGDCRKNGVSGSTALTGRRSHDDRHTDGRELTTGAGGSRRR